MVELRSWSDGHSGSKMKSNLYSAIWKQQFVFRISQKTEVASFETASVFAP